MVSKMFSVLSKISDLGFAEKLLSPVLFVMRCCRVKLEKHSP
jgi:hypothetical protein